jgi:nitrogen fixation protein NifU and related proteins
MDNSQQLYREQLIDHYKNPRNSGEISNFTHSAELKNLSCGDEIKIDLIVEEEEIKNIKFVGRGCAVCIAATSLLTEEIKNSKLSEVGKIKFEDIQEMIGTELSPSRVKCAHLGLLTLQKALE